MSISPEKHLEYLAIVEVENVIKALGIKLIESRVHVPDLYDHLQQHFTVVFVGVTTDYDEFGAKVFVPKMEVVSRNIDRWAFWLSLCSGISNGLLLALNNKKKAVA